MNHPKELIENIIAKLAGDYPAEGGHVYIIEKLLDKGMIPDIMVLRGSALLCAVEIGYTRPEKLTAYRDEFHIPDVRWYDRSGNLHFRWVGASPVFRSPHGTVRVYTRRHVNGCGFTDRNQQGCYCPKWIYSNPRAGKPVQKTADTGSYAEACELAQKLLHSFDTGTAPVPKSMAQALRWYRADVIGPREAAL
jgi:hypothetical protein